MSTTATRQRLIGAAAALTLLGAGLAAGTGTSAAAVCKPSTTVTKKDASTLGVTHNFEKATDPKVGAGAQVIYRIRIGTTGIGNPYVNTVTDYPPSELAGVKPKVRVTALTLLGGILGQTGTPSIVDPIKNQSGWKVTNTGWFVNASHVLQLEYTYKLPTSLLPGKQLTSGGIGVAGTVGIGGDFDKVTACTTIRPPNAGEAITGSLEGAGLGSSDGQLSSTGSIADLLPGIIGGIVGDLLPK